MRTQASSRGSALITAVLAVLIITVIGMAMLRMTYREVAGSTAGAHEQALIACAEAAQVQLASRMHALGFNPSTLSPLSVALAGSSTTVAVGAHYDTPTGGTGSPSVVLEQVQLLPGYAKGPSQDLQDISNRLAGFGGGGAQPFKVIAMCKDGVDGNRKLEIEFGVVFGL